MCNSPCSEKKCYLCGGIVIWDCDVGEDDGILHEYSCKECKAIITVFENAKEEIMTK